MADGWFFFIPHIGDAFIDWSMEARETPTGNDSIDELLLQVSPRLNVPQIQPRAYGAARENCLNTLEDCLRYFSFPNLLQELEDSLESVRKHKKSREKHEEFLKQVDKKMQKLSFKYHPDKVTSRGGSMEELATAQKMQTALNSTRTVLNILNAEFLEDLDIDHKYGLYAKLEITSLGNEEQIKKQISDVLYKTVLLSEIKQVNIIAQIRMFLTESQVSLKKYVDKNEDEFKKHRNYALYHLKKCIDGYEKLLTEFKTIDEECKLEKLMHIESVMKEMADKSSKELSILKKLESVAKCSLEGNFQIFNTNDHMDDYLILPFVYYVNVLLMTSLTFDGKRKSLFSLPLQWNPYSEYVPLPEKTEIEIMLNHAIRIAFMLNKEYQTKSKNIFEERKSFRVNFRDVLNNFLRNLESALEKCFKTEAYVEGGNKKFLLEHYAKCMHMAANIDQTVLNMFKDMQKCQKTDERTKENYDNVMKNNDAFEKEIAESLQQSKLLQEEVSKIFKENDQKYTEEDDVRFKKTDELEKEIAESLAQCKTIQEQVAKILQENHEEIKVENVTDLTISDEFEKVIAGSLEQSKLLQEEVSKITVTKDQGKKAEDEECMKISNEETVECLEEDEQHQDQILNDLKRKDQEMEEEQRKNFKVSNV